MLEKIACMELENKEIAPDAMICAGNLIDDINKNYSMEVGLNLESLMMETNNANFIAGFKAGMAFIKKIQKEALES